MRAGKPTQALPGHAPLDLRHSICFQVEGPAGTRSVPPSTFQLEMGTVLDPGSSPDRQTPAGVAGCRMGKEVRKAVGRSEPPNFGLGEGLPGVRLDVTGIEVKIVPDSFRGGRGDAPELESLQGDLDRVERSGRTSPTAQAV